MADTTMARSVAIGAGAASEVSTSGVTWSAIIAGGVAAAAIALILLGLGAGHRLTAVSPWANSGASATTFGVGAAIWLVVTQWVSAGVGGYLTGRLRTKWVNVHTHEVFFRDTAHGFLVWAVGLVITAAFLTSAATSAIGGAARAGAIAAETSGPAQSRDGYLVDTLL